MCLSGSIDLDITNQQSWTFPLEIQNAENTPLTSTGNLLQAHTFYQNAAMQKFHKDIQLNQV